MAPVTVVETARSPVPAITMFAASRRSLPSGGGSVLLRVRTRGATSCRLGFVRPQHVGATFRRAASICNGNYRITLGPDRQAAAVPAVFRYRATGAGRTVARLLVLRLAAPALPATPTAPPAGPTTSATPTAATPSTPSTSSSTGPPTPPPATTPPPAATTPPATPPPGAEESPNWSGYAMATTTVVSSVAGQLTIPHLACAATPNAGLSEWVGTGGDGGTTGDLLQTGVRSDCVGGVQQDVGWWEQVPGLTEVDFANFPVSPGDTVEASVFQSSGGQWETRLDDLTTGLAGIMVTGEGYGAGPDTATTVTGQASTSALGYAGGDSAEWIVEDYATSPDGSSLASFADYGTLTFSQLETSLPSWSLTPDDAIALVDGNGNVLSMPGAASPSGFTVTYTG